MLANIASATVLGVEGRPVRVEVHVSDGLPAFTMVGLPDTAQREACSRVRSAILSSQQPFPSKRCTVNLAPSGLRKVGPGLDLAIAVGCLVTSGALRPEATEGLGFIGELGLDGAVRPVPGVISLAEAVDAPCVVVAPGAVAEAATAGREVRAVGTLLELVLALSGDQPWPPLPDMPPAPAAPPVPDLADVRGQPVARFAAEVAAAGGHHLLLVGPPGAGKSMLARRLPGILPPLADDAVRSVERVHSAAGVPRHPGAPRRPPFRAPHHGASSVSIVGGGSTALRPGEISLASDGVLFLDELGEFPSQVLDALRQPLEEGVVRVTRATVRASLPARFLLVGAMNPCPCGEGGPPGGCRCSGAARARYQRRLSGPLLDRFDLRVEVGRPDAAQLFGGEPGETSARVAERVAAARAVANERGVRANVELSRSQLDAVAPLDDAAVRLLELAFRSGRLSARGLMRVRAVARTIADLAAPGEHRAVGVEHLAQALGLRAPLASVDQRLAG